MRCTARWLKFGVRLVTGCTMISAGTCLWGSVLREFESRTFPGLAESSLLALSSWDKLFAEQVTNVLLRYGGCFRFGIDVVFFALLLMLGLFPELFFSITFVLLVVTQLVPFLKTQTVLGASMQVSRIDLILNGIR